MALENSRQFSFLKYRCVCFNWRPITLQYCMGSAIHQHESATGVHVFQKIKYGITMPACMPSLLPLWLFVTLRDAAHQAPLSMGFSMQEYCSGLPCSPPRDLPDPGIETAAPVFQADSYCWATGESHRITIWLSNSTSEYIPPKDWKQKLNRYLFASV